MRAKSSSTSRTNTAPAVSPPKASARPDRPKGTPPNCCPQGTTFREGACWPTECGPGTVGAPPHCERACPPDKIIVDQTCYDPCPTDTIGTPPNCKCPDGQYWDDAAKVCKTPEMHRRHGRHAAQLPVPNRNRADERNLPTVPGWQSREQRAMQVPEGEGPVVRRDLQKMRGWPRSDRRPLRVPEGNDGLAQYGERLRQGYARRLRVAGHGALLRRLLRSRRGAGGTYLRPKPCSRSIAHGIRQVVL